MIKFDILIERRREKEKFFKNCLFWAKKIKKMAKKILGDCQVIVFGSILTKKEIPRDIDILIISDKFKDEDLKYKVWVKIKELVAFGSPFEFHFVTKKDYKGWYKNFIKEKVEI